MFKAKITTPKKTQSDNSSVNKNEPTRSTVLRTKDVQFDDSDILDRLQELESKIGELNQLKKSVELAKTAWLGFRKSVRKVCDPAHKDCVTTLSVLDAFFDVSEPEQIEYGG